MEETGNRKTQKEIGRNLGIHAEGIFERNLKETGDSLLSEWERIYEGNWEGNKQELEKN